MKDMASSFQRVAETFENLARCEPDWNVAQHYRFMAKHFKEEASKLLKEIDNGNQHSV